MEDSEIVTVTGNQERVMEPDFQAPEIRPQLFNVHDTEQATLLLEVPEQECTVQHGTQEQSLNQPAASACLLNIPKDSPLIKRQWIKATDSSQETEAEDPFVQLDHLNEALRQVIQHKANLEHCITQKNEANVRKLSVSECQLESTKKDLSDCQKEKDEYKQKHTQATVLIADMSQRFEQQYASLTEQLQEAKKMHKEKEADLQYRLQIQDRCVSNLEAKLKRSDAELENFKSKVKDKQGEVEKLREILLQKEAELKEMETELEERVSEVKICKKLAKDQALNEQQKTVGQNLQTCQEIKKLLERFQHIRTQEELDSIKNQMIQETTKMKASMKHKKSYSWR